MFKQSGFSLIELMITVTVIAILASIAVPSYTDYVTRGRIPEATGALSDARVRAEQFFQDVRTSYPTSCVTAPTAAGAAQIQVPKLDNFTIGCAGAAATFTATATGTGPMSGFVYTINQAGARGTTTVKTGWSGAGKTCWVVRKDGSC